MEPSFLTLDEVLAIHEEQVRLYGGLAGLRDLALLQSALAMPSAGFGDSYLHEDLFAMAAAYLFHLARNHPFLDGNKRVATVAALYFFELNNLEVDADANRLETLVRGVAEGKVSKSEVAEFFRKAARSKK